MPRISRQRELCKLLLSIKASAQRLELLLGICDDRNLQEQLITTYETELQALGITALRTPRPKAAQLTGQFGALGRPETDSQGNQGW